MALELSEDQAALQSAVRRFLQREAPLTKVRALKDDAQGYDEKIWHQLAELGLTSMLVPEELGGGSLTHDPIADLAVLGQEIGRSVTGGPFVGTNLVADALTRSDSNFDEVLQALAAGQATGGWAIAEGATWSASALRAELASTDDGQVLRGRKKWVESAATVDHFLVTARDGDELVQVLVPAGAPGVTVETQDSLDLVRRFGTVVFDDVNVSDAAIVFSGQRAVAEVERQLQIAVALVCAESAGAAERMFDAVIDYAQTRVAFGRPIASYQALKHRLADHKMWLEASFGVVSGLAAAVSQGDPDAPRLASIAKAHVTANAVDALQDCVQIFGGIGLTYEHDIHLFLRRAMTNFMLYGSPADHRERLCVLAGL